MKRKSALSAILEAKCPQCRQGKMFLEPIYKINKLADMPKKCEVCGFYYEREPGFFYGAMYVSYGLSVGVFLSTVFVLYWIFQDPSLTTYIASIVSTSMILYPFTFRYSRVLFLNIFGGAEYKPLD